METQSRIDQPHAAEALGVLAHADTPALSAALEHLAEPAGGRGDPRPRDRARSCCAAAPAAAARRSISARRR